MTELRSRAAWRALENHYEDVRDLHLHDSSTTALIRRYRRSRNGRES